MILPRAGPRGSGAHQGFSDGHRAMRLTPSPGAQLGTQQMGPLKRCSRGQAECMTDSGTTQPVLKKCQTKCPRALHVCPEGPAKGWTAGWIGRTLHRHPRARPWSPEEPWAGPTGSPRLSALSVTRRSAGGTGWRGRRGKTGRERGREQASGNWAPQPECRPPGRHFSLCLLCHQRNGTGKPSPLPPRSAA